MIAGSDEILAVPRSQPWVITSWQILELHVHQYVANMLFKSGTQIEYRQFTLAHGSQIDLWELSQSCVLTSAFIRVVL